MTVLMTLPKLFDPEYEIQVLLTELHAVARAAAAEGRPVSHAEIEAVIARLHEPWQVQAMFTAAMLLVVSGDWRTN